mmetsp:Transcript_3456/g.9671  ORF Transcript_3456/g.9671 Transcript_3456/m.9671 type:complete len:243 (+) Transcript_3456:777-1505(+)
MGRSKQRPQAKNRPGSLVWCQRTPAGCHPDGRARRKDRTPRRPLQETRWSTTGCRNERQRFRPSHGDLRHWNLPRPCRENGGRRNAPRTRCSRQSHDGGTHQKRREEETAIRGRDAEPRGQRRARSQGASRTHHAKNHGRNRRRPQKATGTCQGNPWQVPGCAQLQTRADAKCSQGSTRRREASTTQKARPGQIRSQHGRGWHRRDRQEWWKCRQSARSRCSRSCRWKTPSSRRRGRYSRRN